MFEKLKEKLSNLFTENQSTLKQYQKYLEQRKKQLEREQYKTVDSLSYYRSYFPSKTNPLYYYCMDCEKIVPITIHTECSICGSKSVMPSLPSESKKILLSGLKKG